MTNAQVLPIRRPHRTRVVHPVLAAETGNRPVLCLCDDGAKYWCKNFSEEYQDVAVNEIVSAEIGQVLGAPILDWAVVEVPEPLRGRRVGMAHLGQRPMFGSRELPSAQHSYDVTSIRKDGNAERIPFLVALWYLCNAEDIQLLYAMADDAQIWSIDHGYWFGSYEGTRGLFMPSELAGRTDPPPIRRGTSPEAWDAAAEAVQNLTPGSLAHIPGMVPSEWGVPKGDLEDMTAYVLSRVPYTLGFLDDHARRARTEG